MDWKVWLKGLAAAVVSAAASAAALVLGDGTHFNLESGWPALKTAALVGMLVGLVGYLVKSPVPWAQIKERWIARRLARGPWAVLLTVALVLPTLAGCALFHKTSTADELQATYTQLAKTAVIIKNGETLALSAWQTELTAYQSGLFPQITAADQAAIKTAFHDIGVAGETAATALKDLTRSNAERKAIVQAFIDAASLAVKKVAVLPDGDAKTAILTTLSSVDTIVQVALTYWS